MQETPEPFDPQVFDKDYREAMSREHDREALETADERERVKGRRVVNDGGAFTTAAR